MGGLIVLAVILGAGAAAYFVVKHKLEKFSRSVFGTKSIVDGINKQADIAAMTPKSVSGMTRIFESQIQSDFPDFNLDEFRTKVEIMLTSALRAIDEGKIELLLEGTDEVKRQVQDRIAANKADGISEVYEKIRVHRTEITRYEKVQGKCVITFQSAVEHMHYKMQNGKVISGDENRLEQTKYNIELMYVQDASKLEYGNAVGTTCPNCGAPISNLGAMYCEYCGLAVTPINIKVWNLNNFYEVDYNHV